MPSQNQGFLSMCSSLLVVFQSDFEKGQKSPQGVAPVGMEAGQVEQLYAET